VAWWTAFAIAAAVDQAAPWTSQVRQAIEAWIPRHSGPGAIPATVRPAGVPLACLVALTLAERRSGPDLRNHLSGR
jgi:hypothetical protein